MLKNCLSYFAIALAISGCGGKTLSAPAQNSEDVADKSGEIEKYIEDLGSEDENKWGRAHKLLSGDIKGNSFALLANLHSTQWPGVEGEKEVWRRLNENSRYRQMGRILDVLVGYSPHSQNRLTQKEIIRLIVEEMSPDRHEVGGHPEMIVSFYPGPPEGQTYTSDEAEILLRIYTDPSNAPELRYNFALSQLVTACLNSPFSFSEDQLERFRNFVFKSAYEGDTKSIGGHLAILAIHSIADADSLAVIYKHCAQNSTYEEDVVRQLRAASDNRDRFLSHKPIN